jgi:hypothetical protein
VDVIHSGLKDRRVQLSGSASKSTPVELIKYSHQLVSQIVGRILEHGGGLVLSVGKEPLFDESGDSPSLIFDWTALEIVAACQRSGKIAWSGIAGPPIFIVTSEKAYGEIPEARKSILQELLRSGYMNIEYIQPGARSGAMIRDRQAHLGDILLAIGGGSGVEHSAEIYTRTKSPVIALDPPLGASREDGSGGAYKLARETRANPSSFFLLQSEFQGTAGALYSTLETRSGSEDPALVAENIVKLLERLALPVAFYTRLLNPDIDAFSRVEDFFRSVVDPAIDDAGYRRHEVGTDRSPEPFINTAIFENLHYSSVVIADLTENRNNCYMELGYAFGRGTKVIMTAEKGTHLPFDPQAVPCHFWTFGEDNKKRKEAFLEFWRTNIDRGPLVAQS